MAAASFVFCSFLSIFFIVATMTSAGSLASSPTPYSGDNSTEFVRASCRSTLYPDLCFASLARYAPAVQHNPIRLARLAAKLTFSQLHSAAAQVSSYLRAPPSTGPEAAALRDCLDSLSNAADQTRRSATEIGKLDRGGGCGAGGGVAGVEHADVDERGADERGDVHGRVREGGAGQGEGRRVQPGRAGKAVHQ